MGRYADTFTVLTRWIMQISARPVIHSAYSFVNTAIAPVMKCIKLYTPLFLNVPIPKDSR